MKILITGAKGFIGEHLTRFLHEAGHEITGVDFSDGDLREEGVADRLIGFHTPHTVIHLAAQVGIYFNEQDCVHAVNSNTLMTLRVAQACKRHGARLVHTSTSEVYGDYGDRLIDEEAPLVGRPTGIYALSKRWSEDAAREYSDDRLIIIRPSMPYGPGAPPGKGRRAMDNMLWQAFHRKPITVHRDAVRSWCWVGDLCRGYQIIIESGQTGAFNIGRDDDERTMLEIAQRSCEIFKADRSLIKVIDPPAKKTMIKRLSTARLQALGWKPDVELYDGMRSVAQWVTQFPWTE